MKHLAEGFWTTLTLLCSGIVGLVALAYSFVVSILGSKVINPSAESSAYRFHSWVSMVIALSSLFIFLLVFGIVAIRRRHSRW